MRWLNYFQNPGRVGPLARADCSGRSGGGCGDRVELQLKFDGDVIEDAAFLASGCPAAIAGAAACASLVCGLTLIEAAQVRLSEILEVLEDAPVERDNCVRLSAVALANALESFLSSGSVRLPLADRVAVAMSGGVDRSTAAFALRAAGHEIIGLTQRLHDYGRPGAKSCCTLADIDDAREVAAVGGFPHLTVDMRDSFAAKVVAEFCLAYLSGRTPNPCVECNRHLRFAGLVQTAQSLGAPRLATGHYVRIVGPDGTGQYSVRRAIDISKDQSYMFWSADQKTLAHLCTPLGELTKVEVREMAESYGLPVAKKTESQDVCFIPDGDYAAFVCSETGHKSATGPIVHAAGEVLGTHRGLINYTVGQRRGIGVSAAEPLYVIALDMARNTLIVGGLSDLNVPGLCVSQVNYIDIDPSRGSFKCQVMIRYNGDLEFATVYPLDAGRANVEFDRPFGPVAPGQSAVFYDGDTVLGGGIIT